MLKICYIIVLKHVNNVLNMLDLLAMLKHVSDVLELVQKMLTIRYNILNVHKKVNNRLKHVRKMLATC